MTEQQDLERRLKELELLSDGSKRAKEIIERKRRDVVRETLKNTPALRLSPPTTGEENE